MPESQGLFSLKKQICPLLQIVLGALRVKHFLMCLCACAHKPLHVFIYMAATYQRQALGKTASSSTANLCKFVNPSPTPSLPKKKKTVKSKKQFP